MFSIPIISMTDFYDASLTKLGILSDAEVASVMNAYLRHKQIRDSVADLLAVDAPVAKRSVQVSAGYRDILQTMWEGLLPDIDAALSAMRSSETLT